ncbi:hypothetical protein J2R98_000159 [Alkalibacillus filiformis]|uniref:Restriction endonuclease n=1 Tax=Alkalibacillus filiformis TaxID=200990 RepID=A0ABU0DPJ3_9BACI|nr:hypothetical protein [Alkalibacillus filiformis]MDQ0350356.1 hypothetical protein [Alkalibacillus filiformis]
MDLMLYKNEIEEELLRYSNQCVKENEYDYTTFGKEIEPILSEGLRFYFMSKFNFSESDFYEAPNKNHFPDFTLCREIAIEFKAAVYNRKPENDMGTINSWSSKLKEYGDNIYYIFVKYSTVNTYVNIEDVFFDKVYRFIGLNSAGFLRYREKDGNLRPKSWEDFDNAYTYCDSLMEFQEGLRKSESYRARRLVEKHFPDVSEEDRRIIKEKYFDN